jgi:hypothetical protein
MKIENMRQWYKRKLKMSVEMKIENMREWYWQKVKMSAEWKLKTCVNDINES